MTAESTVMLPDIALLERLDFDPSCDSDPCDRIAEWYVRLNRTCTCGPDTLLYCDACYQVVNRMVVIAAGRTVIFCTACRAKVTVVRMGRLK